MTRAQISLLPDGRRLQCNDGPIDLIIQAFGEAAEVHCAYAAAATRFVDVLDELCHELPTLRQRPQEPPRGRIARKMFAAVLPFSRNGFITPMAAVAGAVAEEILHSMTSAATLTRAYVNNGGDIAFHLTPQHSFTTGMISLANSISLFGTLKLHYQQPARGLATSGWRGRSFSLGIADAVTVLARSASEADAAATVIANAVDLPGHPAILRVPANTLAPDSDLGHRLVTQAVGDLTPDDIATALDAGAAVARALLHQDLICSAALNLQQETRVITNPSQQMHSQPHSPRSLLHA